MFPFPFQVKTLLHRVGYSREPGNRVPRKSFNLRRNIWQESRFSHDIYKRKKDFLLSGQFPKIWFDKGNDFMSEETFSVK